MATNTIKKVLLTGVFALSAAFLLSACDSVSAVPANYESPVVLKDGNAFDDDDNKLGAIYDALVGNKNSKVESALLKFITEKEFGTYAEIKACFNADGTVKEAEARAHIAKYAHYFVKDDDAAVATKAGSTVEELQLKRFKYFYEDLNERIDKKVFKEIEPDTYRDTVNKTEFLEEKYARSLRKQNYEILHFKANGEVEDGFAFKKVFLDSDFKEENVRDYLSDFDATYADYITKSLIPDVYKDKLIEEYIIDSNYSALGRAYGRYVNYVKVSYSSDDPNTAYRLVNKFTKDYLASAERVGSDIDYSTLVNWVKGFDGIGTNVASKPYVTGLVNSGLDDIYGAPRKLLAKCEKDPISSAASKLLFLPLFEDNAIFGGIEGADASARFDNFTFYEKTKLGEILKNYEKAVAAEATRFAFDDKEYKEQYDAFTKNGSKEQGLLEEITKVALENEGKMTNEGWFVKNDKDGSLGLPDEIKNRLFNIKVSNDFDKADWKYEKGESYFNKLQGHAYITPASATDAEYDFILRDTAGSALYIVEVLEAPSTSKLNKTNDKSYVQAGKDVFKCENIAREIAKILGTKDTYKTNAYTSYLKLYTFTYHDTSVYDYLKETYPNLFEDED